VDDLATLSSAQFAPTEVLKNCPLVTVKRIFVSTVGRINFAALEKNVFEIQSLAEPLLTRAKKGNNFCEKRFLNIVTTMVARFFLV
jgi:hypothetical protein